MKKPEERHAWIKQYIANNSAGVDILFGDFVDEYIVYVGARYRPTCWGAYKCKALGKDLSDMAKRGELRRGRATETGLQRLGSRGHAADANGSDAVGKLCQRGSLQDAYRDVTRCNVGHIA